MIKQSILSSSFLGLIIVVSFSIWFALKPEAMSLVTLTFMPGFDTSHDFAKMHLVAQLRYPKANISYTIAAFVRQVAILAFLNGQ